jgi:hypothetical protein
VRRKVAKRLVEKLPKHKSREYISYDDGREVYIYRHKGIPAPYSFEVYKFYASIFDPDGTHITCAIYHGGSIEIDHFHLDRRGEHNHRENGRPSSYGFSKPLWVSVGKRYCEMGVEVRSHEFFSFSHFPPRLRRKNPHALG